MAKGSARADSGRMAYGSGRTVCGRRFCGKCGKWRHVVDFPAHNRNRGYVTKLSNWCHTCHRLDQRRRRADPEFRARRREYDRIYKEAQRRAAGVPARPVGRKANKVTESTRLELELAPFKEAFDKSGVSVNALAKRMGINDRLLARMLGMQPRTHTDPRYNGKCSTRISYKNAVAIVLALDLDPVDFGV